MSLNLSKEEGDSGQRGRKRACECHQEVFDEQTCAFFGDPLSLTDPYHEYSSVSDCQRSCEQSFGGQVELCVAQYESDCEALIDCMHGRPHALPSCPEGAVNAGGNGVCLPLCDANHPCEEGACHPWMGSGVAGKMILLGIKTMWALIQLFATRQRSCFRSCSVCCF